MKIIYRKFFGYAGRFITSVINNNFYYKVFNFVFEHSPYILCKKIVYFISFPDADNIWKIKLFNKKVVRTKIYKGSAKTYHFAIAYRSHNYAINKIELILNEYYKDSSLAWIDVGSNMGLRSLLALSEGRPVYFIEPNREVNNLNIDRCRLNNFNNYTLLEYGASDKCGEAEFAVDTTSYGSSIEKNYLSPNAIDHIEKIKIATLDELLCEYIKKYEQAYIKIDVEGHELKVLDGAKNIINKLSPAMLIEVNKKENRFREFYEKLTSMDYKIFETYRFSAKKILKYLSEIPDNLAVKSNDFLCIKNDRLFKHLLRYTLTK